MIYKPFFCRNLQLGHCLRSLALPCFLTNSHCLGPLTMFFSKYEVIKIKIIIEKVRSNWEVAFTLRWVYKPYFSGCLLKQLGQMVNLKDHKRWMTTSQRSLSWTFLWLVKVSRHVTFCDMSNYISCNYQYMCIYIYTVYMFCIYICNGELFYGWGSWAVTHLHAFTWRDVVVKSRVQTAPGNTNHAPVWIWCDYPNYI